MKNKFLDTLLFLSVSICILFTNCETEIHPQVQTQKSSENSPYLNHSDSAKYVGMNTCKLCHQSIYNTFIKTGMGKSFAVATQTKSAGNFKNAHVYDKFLEMHYHAYFNKDSLYINEFRLEKKDTIFSRTEQVNYIIGSGQHTNSHIQSVNGYLNQMPMTFYTQKQKWDLPPGFENGINTRFTRKIGLECMSCHNGYPDFVKGSENKYKSVPQGIDCERCHGPGSIHVEQKQNRQLVDTSKQIDYSIVNPSKLSIDLQFDVCQRCHLQGNAVLKNNHSFYDFKPGQKLNDYISVFLPKYKNADDEFIMASHADRLKQSQCFIKSIEKAKKINSLKPYKDAMTCITCHNPHVSVRETNKEVFNDACRQCHLSSKSADGREQTAVAIHPAKVCLLPSQSTANCVSCHMPQSGSIDIPHVSVHDHYIRKPISTKETKKIKEFLGLFAINEKNPGPQTKAIAYIQQYEKFDQNKSYLDSAKKYLSDKTKSDIEKNIHELIKLNFMTQNFKKNIDYVNALNEEHCFKDLFKSVSYDNKDAWACYHIAESYYYTSNLQTALKWFERACSLAEYNLEFKNKYGSALGQANLINPAITQFKKVIQENPNNVSAYTNLGYIKMLQGQTKEAFAYYSKGLSLDPDYEPLLLNIAGYYLFIKDNKKAIEFLKKIVKKNPKNTQAILALKQIQTLY